MQIPNKTKAEIITPEEQKTATRFFSGNTHFALSGKEIKLFLDFESFSTQRIPIPSKR